MTGKSAGDRLAEAERLAAIVRRRSRWTVWTYIVTGTTGFVFAPVLAFPGRRLVFWLGMGAWMAIAATSQAIIRRRPVEPRSYRTRYDALMGAWFAAWLLVVGFGYWLFPGDLAFWLPGAAMTAVIMYVGAFLEIREMRR